MEAAAKVIMDEKAMERTIVRMSFEIVEHNRGSQGLCIVGVMGGGVDIANRIAQKISQIENREIERGYLDITGFRDDEKKDPRREDRSELPFSVDAKHVVLVDDVLYTGRTVRAAIEAVLRRGRPRSIQLAVLVDRGHRELPIRPDVVGKNLPTASDELVVVKTRLRNGLDEVSITKCKRK